MYIMKERERMNLSSQLISSAWKNKWALHSQFKHLPLGGARCEAWFRARLSELTELEILSDNKWN
jgi:hypothetical protein